MKKVAGKIKADLAQYREMAALRPVRLRPSTPSTQPPANRGPAARLTELLKPAVSRR
jgi:F0F1-type ATP synthase alpha subunit